MFLDKIQLEAGENVIIHTRRHWFVLLSQLAGPVIAGFAPLILISTALFFKEGSSLFMFNAEEFIPHLTFFYAAWILLLIMGAFNIWTNYYLDVITITDRRIILVNQKGFWKRNIGSFRLERLQDLNVEIDGILATLLDYGNLNAETAGHGEEGFRTYGLPHPRELKAAILKATDALIVEYRNRPLSTDGLQ